MCEDAPHPDAEELVYWASPDEDTDLWVCLHCRNAISVTCNKCSYVAILGCETRPTMRFLGTESFDPPKYPEKFDDIGCPEYLVLRPNARPSQIDDETACGWGDLEESDYARLANLDYSYLRPTDEAPRLKAPYHRKGVQIRSYWGDRNLHCVSLTPSLNGDDGGFEHYWHCADCDRVVFINDK